MLALGATGVHYEIFVRAFADSNGDGLGDLNGVTDSLPYLKDLGVSALWLMPINPSPTYHKYDVVDYYGVDPEYGTLNNIRRLVAEAHRLGIAVLLDLVVHHTSIRHPWFQEAAKGPDSPYRDFYRWMTPENIRAKNLLEREITADSAVKNPWHRVQNATYDEQYYGMFWAGMPDLNFDHRPVREEIFKVGRFWLNDVGVDGFRLDAARHLYPESEEAKNHEFWQEFRQEMTLAKPDVFLIGEVWTRPDRIAPYFRGLHANFNFDLRLAIEQAVRDEDDTDDLIQFLHNAQTAYGHVAPDFLDALILSNHDQNRIGSLLAGNVTKLKVAANLLLTLPGLPYIYYGEELGMLGLKPDEHLREPFLWDEGLRDPRRTRWRKAKYSTSKTVRPLAAQQRDPDSLYHHYKNMIALRSAHPVLNDNRSRLWLSTIRQRGVVAFGREQSTGKRVLVLHNLTGSHAVIALPDAERHFQYVAVALATADNVAVGPDAVRLPPYSCVVLGEERQ